MTDHSLQIERIVEQYGAKRKMFKAAVIAALVPDMSCEADSEHLKASITIIPDAYDIEPEVRTITIFEVEDRNPITAEKMARIVRLMHALDYFEWALRLVATDIWNTDRLIDQRVGWKLLVERGKALRGTGYLHARGSGGFDRTTIGSFRQEDGMEEYAVFFENGAWVVMRQDEFGNVSMREVAPSLEDAIQGVSLLTGAQVGIKLITKQR